MYTLILWILLVVVISIFLAVNDELKMGGVLAVIFITFLLVLFVSGVTAVFQKPTKTVVTEYVIEPLDKNQLFLQTNDGFVVKTGGKAHILPKEDVDVYYYSSKIKLVRIVEEQRGWKYSWRMFPVENDVTYQLYLP